MCTLVDLCPFDVWTVMLQMVGTQCATRLSLTDARTRRALPSLITEFKFDPRLSSPLTLPIYNGLTILYVHHACVDFLWGRNYLVEALTCLPRLHSLSCYASDLVLLPCTPPSLALTALRTLKLLDTLPATWSAHASSFAYVEALDKLTLSAQIPLPVMPQLLWLDMRRFMNIEVVESDAANDFSRLLNRLTHLGGLTLKHAVGALEAASYLPPLFCQLTNLKTLDFHATRAFNNHADGHYQLARLFGALTSLTRLNLNRVHFHDTQIAVQYASLSALRQLHGTYWRNKTVDGANDDVSSLGTNLQQVSLVTQPDSLRIIRTVLRANSATLVNLELQLVEPLNDAIDWQYIALPNLTDVCFKTSGAWMDDVPTGALFTNFNLVRCMPRLAQLDVNFLCADGSVFAVAPFTLQSASVHLQSLCAWPRLDWPSIQRLYIYCGTSGRGVGQRRTCVQHSNEVLRELARRDELHSRVTRLTLIHAAPVYQHLPSLVRLFPRLARLYIDVALTCTWSEFSSCREMLAASFRIHPSLHYILLYDKTTKYLTSIFELVRPPAVLVAVGLQMCDPGFSLRPVPGSSYWCWMPVDTNSLTAADLIARIPPPDSK